MSGLRAYGAIIAAGLLLAAIPALGGTDTLLNALVTALIIALAGLGWNLLGGYGGQFSFGHAAFFGAGAYADAVLQARFGLNGYAAFAAGVLAGALVGWIIGILSFRAGLRGSYFALITLAFAEVLRIASNAAPVTGGAAGTLIKLQPTLAHFQFPSRASAFWVALGCVIGVMLLMRAIERHRLGTYLVAIRENENAARALGVDTLRVKLVAITLSGAITALAGALYAQYFLFVDANIAFGTWISVQALLAPIIGGIGTVFGPLLGAMALHFLGEFTRAAAEGVPGIDLALFGALLILAVAFARDGIVGLLVRLRAGLAGGGRA